LPPRPRLPPLLVIVRLLPLPLLRRSRVRSEPPAREGWRRRLAPPPRLCSDRRRSS